MEKYLCWYEYEEPYVPHDIMVGSMVGSTSGSSNLQGVVDDNSNPYRNIVMDAIGMNQGHAGLYPIVNEEPNANMTRFFYLLKDFEEPLWDDCTNHSKLSIVIQVFNIKSDHRLSEAGYDRIIE
jgi:hypothetical protein